MNSRKKSQASQNKRSTTESDKAEVNSLSRKLRDLEEMYQKLKRANDNSKADYEKHKAKLSKVGLIRPIASWRRRS